MKILVALDFSGNSTHAAEQAIIWSQSREVELGFVYVSKVLTPTGSLTYGVPVESSAQHIAKRKEDLKQFVDEIKSRYKINREFNETYLVENSAKSSDGIVNAAKEWGADMILMGNKGESNVATKLFGSTTTAVLDKAEVPVITIPSEYLKNDWNTIGLGTDLVSIEKDIISNADLLKRISDKMDLVHIRPVFPEKVPLATFDTEELITSLKEKTGIEFNWRLITTDKENDITGGMDKYVRDYNPDMLIMFYTRRNWLEKLIDSSTTKSMVLSNRVAVLSIKRNPKIA